MVASHRKLQDDHLGILLIFEILCNLQQISILVSDALASMIAKLSYGLLLFNIHCTVNLIFRELPCLELLREEDIELLISASLRLRKSKPRPDSYDNGQGHRNKSRFALEITFQWVEKVGCNGETYD